MDPLMMPSQVGELGELLSTDVASAVAGRVHCGVGASHVLVKIVVLKVTMFTFVFHCHTRLEYFVHNLHVLVDVRVLLPAQLAHCPRLQVDHLIVGVVVGLPSSGIATQFTLEHGGLALLS